MATIPQFPFSLSFSSLHYRKPFFYYHQQPRLFVSNLNSTKKKKHGFVCFACSIKQSRVRKRVKSNEELRSEIMEFVALNRFPEGHIPSMKELSAHGRVDLANVVRRRGYKFIKELLANSDLQDCKELVSATSTSMETSASGSSLEVLLTEGQDEEALSVVDGNLSTESTAIHITSTDGSTPLNFHEEDVISTSSPVAEEHESLSIDESSLAGVSSIDNSFYNMDDSNQLGEMTENNLKIESVKLNDRAEIEVSSSEASISTNHSLVLDDTLSCTDREADNVLAREDEDVNDVIEDSSLTWSHYTSQDLNYTKRADIATESFYGLTSEDTMANAESFQNQQIDDMAEKTATSSIEEKTARFMQNGYLDTVDDDENESSPQETRGSVETTRDDEFIGDSYVNQRSLSMPLNGSALALEEVSYATEVNSSDSNKDHRGESADLDKDSHDETMKRENQVEITRLKFMLRQKELELSRLKEQIEKEKLSLSALQRQAETEIEKAQMLISEKDAELQEAEGSLSGLQEVEIEYCGDGNVVEVTGSFNGWQHRVGMELQPSKSIGKQKCWSALLWLYPGKYEIKFIVDGQWTTDPQLDSVTRGHITNNILKVDR